MFERFTERARQVVLLAREEAFGLKRRYIDTEHILLGLLREGENLASHAFESHGLTADRVRDAVSRLGGAGADEAMPVRDSFRREAFAPHAARALELALREALALGQNYIGPEHILLGLLRQEEGLAARILLDFDADSEKIRNEVIRMLSGRGGRQRVGAHEGVRQPLTPSLDQRREALRRANEIRAMRARMKRELDGHGDSPPD